MKWGPLLTRKLHCPFVSFIMGLFFRSIMRGPRGRGAIVGMIRIRTLWKTAVGVALSLALLSAQALAEEEKPKRFDLSAVFRYSFPVGEEEAGVAWSDLYADGVGGALEVTYRATRRFALYVGAAYHRYKGEETLLETPFGIFTGRFNDQKLLSAYVGVKGYLLGAALPQKSGGIDPYLRADLGLTQFNGANFNGDPIADRSREFAFSVGLGADLLTYTNFILFFEARYEDHGIPDQAGKSFRAVPISLGVRYLM